MPERFYYTYGKTDPKKWGRQEWAAYEAEEKRIKETIRDNKFWEAIKIGTILFLGIGLAAGAYGYIKWKGAEQSPFTQTTTLERNLIEDNSNE